MQSKCTQAFCSEQLSNIVTSGLALNKDDGEWHWLATTLGLPGLFQQDSRNIVQLLCICSFLECLCDVGSGRADLPNLNIDEI